MKKIILLVAVLFMAVASQAQTLQSLFEKYSENENFEYVSVGGNGMTVASANGNVAKSKNAGPKKKSTKILTLKAGADSQIMKTFEKELNAVLEAGKFETTLETRSKGESTHIYYRSLGNDNADQLIVAKTKTELSLIWESGKLDKGQMKYGISSTGDEEVLDEANLDKH
jgi:hypothetical protein